MSASSDFFPSRDLRDLRTLDLSSPECRSSVQNNLDSLARVLGASGGQITHPPPHAIERNDACRDDALPSVEAPPPEVDSFEKSYITRWLTRLISELSSICSDDDEADSEAEQISQRCAELLALSAGRMAAGASIQDHIFQLTEGPLTIKLRDGALVHDSLGTHTWGAAPILSQLLLPLDSAAGHDLKVLELGAGTGLVGLAIALWSRRHRPKHDTEIICTDYHPTVLENLAHNITLNDTASNDTEQSRASTRPSDEVRISARCLDWQSVHRSQSGHSSAPAQEELTSQTLPSHLILSKDSEWAQILDVDAYSGAFDMIVAADCVYDPVHPIWIRSVAQKLLRRSNPSSDHRPALLHVMVPLRPTHQQEMQAVYQAFEASRDLNCPQLVILSQQDYRGYENFGSWNSVVRSDGAAQSQPEGGLARTYRWFQIGWQQP